MNGIDAQTMQAIGAVAVLVIALIAIAKAAQPVLWLWNLLFGNFARKPEVRAVSESVAKIHEQLGGFVTQKEYEHHNRGVAQATQDRNTTVNRVLDIHEKDINEAHKRMDDVLKDMNKGFSDIKDLLLARLPKP